jgi:Ran GTPase-activating protein (RanGAP) involved in mRNA processing and transport
MFRPLLAGAMALADALTGNAKIEGLYLSGNSIGNAGLLALGRALTHPATALSTLVLTNNAFGDDGLCALAEALAINSHLHHLQVNCNADVGDRGIIALAHVLSQPSAVLQNLGLGATGYGTAAAMAIADMLHTNSSLTFLDMADGEGVLAPEGVAALAAAVRVNESLHFYSGPGGDK